VTISMDEFEKVQTVATAFGLALSSVGIYMTVVTAFLAASHTIGKNLTQLQALFLSSVFVFFSLFSFWGSVVYFKVGVWYGRDADSLPPITTISFDLNPALIIGSFEILGIIVSLFYLYNVRSRARINATNNDNAIEDGSARKQWEAGINEATATNQAKVIVLDWILRESVIDLALLSEKPEKYLEERFERVSAMIDNLPVDQGQLVTGEARVTTEHFFSTVKARINHPR